MLWRELFLFAVVIPAGILTAGVIIFKKYAKSPQGKIDKIQARQTEAEKLKARYESLMNIDPDYMTASDFDEIAKLIRRMDKYDKMVDRKV